MREKAISCRNLATGVPVPPISQGSISALNCPGQRRCYDAEVSLPKSATNILPGILRKPRSIPLGHRGRPHADRGSNQRPEVGR
jgi:hypothetical protein